MELRYLLFDLDGTLIDTTDLILSCYRSSVSRLVETPPTDEDILKGFGTPLTRQLHRLYPTLRDRLDELTVMWRASQEELHDQLIKPFPSTERVLGELHRRGYPLGIVTSKERTTAERGMALYGIDRLVNVVVSMDDTINHKPHPEPLLRAMDLMGASPEETIYVGDSVHDMQAGRAAGVRVAAALWGPFAREPLLEFGPDFLLKSLDGLLDLCPPLR
jgi:pyrophosphatase PpaX